MKNLFDDLTLESNMTYSVFYRRFGVRRVSDILSPKVSNIVELKLPKAAVAHHISYDGLSLGPEPTGSVYSKHSGRVLVEHITEHFEPDANPRVMPGKTPLALTRDYHKRFKQYRPLRDFERSVREDKTLIIENYAILNQAYKYQQTLYAPFYKWANIVKTVFHNIGRVTGLCSRDQFVFIRLPEIMPSVEALRFAAASNTLKRDLIETFSSAEACFILELWRWLDDNPDVKSSLSHIPVDELDKVNLVFMDGPNWFVLNLKSFIDIEDIDGEEGGGRVKQRRFMLMLLSLIDARHKEVGEIQDDAEDGGDDDDVEIIVETESVKETPQEELSGKRISENPYDDPADDYSVVDDEPTVSVEQTKSDAAASKLVKELDDEEIEEKLNEANTIASKQSKATEKPIKVRKHAKEPKDVLLQKLDDLADSGSITAGEYKRAKANIEKTQSLPNPFGDGTLVSHAVVTDDDVFIKEGEADLPELKGVVDKSMLRNSIGVLDKKYIKSVMGKHMCGVLLSVQKAGLIVNDVNVQTVEEYGNHYNIYKLKTTTLKGETSTVTFRLPVVQEDRTFTANGVKYHLKKQKVDIPIRKVNTSRVALTSDYGKLFVERSDKSVVNYPRWLHRQIGLIRTGEANVELSNVKHLTTFTPDVLLPRIYTVLASEYREFTIDNKYRIYVDYVHRNDAFGEDVIAAAEEDGLFFCGMSGKVPILVGNDNVFYLKDPKGIVELGTIETLLKITDKVPPVEIAEFSVFGKQIPIGIALGYRYGLTQLLTVLGVTARRVFVGQNANVQPDEFAIKFADETLVFPRGNKVAELVLGGFNRYHKTLIKYNVGLFDSQDVYVNTLEDNGFRIGIIRELALAYDMFVDPITEQILVKMKEPTTLEELLIRSCELLTTDHHPEEVDESVMRYRGYERFPGAVYKQLVSSVRQQRSQGAGGVSKLQMNPEAVWMSVIQDGSSSPIEESNPIQNLKEAEIYTFGGTGGRSARSMVKRTRKFTDASLGVTSEATVDSGMVGVNAYLSSDPKIDSIYGLPETKRPDELSPANLFSTSALMAPAVEMDSPPRINFVSIQHSHGVAVAGGRALPFRTGKEKTLAHSVGPLFASTAPMDGKVIELSDKHIKVQYKDKTEASFELGVKHGTVTGTTVPHKLVTTFALNEKVKAGDVVVYNEGFFEPDALDPKQVLWRAGVLANVAIAEAPHTYEDSSEISERISELLTTKMTYIRTVVIRFDQEVANMVKEGDHVDIESILCTVEDAVTADNDMFDDSSIETLTMLASHTPKAKHDGVIDKIETLYHGDYEDMSESVRRVVDASDKKLKRHAKLLGKTPVTGEINNNVRVDGNPLELDTIAVRFYITCDVPAGVGDKAVFANQMKTVHSNVLSGVNRTESGVEIDAKFSYMSIMGRAVLSPEVIGTTIRLLEHFSKEASDAYFGD